ncbi:hypothetical protein ABIA30_000384 [Mycobacterium sp. MAA66]|uniref:DUF732 domain-containing protein n=1 Tax=Mycobacterium sp. MAA66 TaxID=3156297 RepID=UPI0035167726
MRLPTCLGCLSIGLVLTGCAAAIPGTPTAPAGVTSIEAFPPPPGPDEVPPDMYDQLRARGVEGTDEKLTAELVQACTFLTLGAGTRSHDEVAHLLTESPSTLSLRDAKVIVLAAATYICAR